MNSCKAHFIQIIRVDSSFKAALGVRNQGAILLRFADVSTHKVWPEFFAHFNPFLTYKLINVLFRSRLKNLHNVHKLLLAFLNRVFIGAYAIKFLRLTFP